jgi:hypothetical protein
MRALVLAVLAAAIFTPAAAAQQVVTQVQKNGKQVVTEIQVSEQVNPPVVDAKKNGKPAPENGQIKPPPAVEGKAEGDIPAASAQVMKVHDWKCGRYFTDDQNKRWKLLAGPPIEHHPNQLSGWRLSTVDGQVAYFTITGRLFQQQPQP